MTELPIVVETSDWPQTVFGVILLGISFLLLQGMRSADNLNGAVKAGLGMLLCFGLGLALLVQHLGWQLRVDEKGIALRAPFDVLYPGGQIAWPDITSVEVFDQAYRGPAYFLRVRGRDGAEVLVANPGMLPQEFAVALQKTIAERAPQVADTNDLLGQLEPARRNTGLLHSTFSARDGRGNALR
jgi:hypothetical protein